MVGEKIKKLRETKDLSINELARIAEINPSYLSAIERGKKRNPSYKILKKIARALGVHVGALIQEDVDHFVLKETSESYKSNQAAKHMISMKLIDYITKKFKPENNIDIDSVRELDFDNVRMVPMIGRIAAGIPVLAEEHIEGYMPIDMCFLDPNKDYYLLKVKGDSMNLEFPDGTWVLVEKTDCIENGQLGVVLVDAEEATIKKVVFNRNMVTLIPMSTNPVYQPIMYDLEKDDVRIQGRVVMALKTY